jgi:hypothetical protein
MRHQHQAKSVKNGAGAQHTDCAEPVGNRAGNRLSHPPEEILHGQREGEDIAAPMIGARQGREKKAERGARAEGDCGDQTAADDDDRRRSPVCRH